VTHERVELGEIDHGQQDLERDVFVAPGGVTLVRSDLFRTLRGFDPLIPVLGEDLDLCWRAQVAGARIVVAPLARVAHRETIASGEREVSALGVRAASRQALQRRHQLLVVATGSGRVSTLVTMVMLFVMDTMEFVLALIGRDHERSTAILGSWRWLLKNQRRVRERRRQRHEFQVLSDAEVRRLQVAGASRLKRFFLILLRDGLDHARGILPPETEADDADLATDGVGFAAAFAESEEFDEIPESASLTLRAKRSRFLTSFRSQATLLVAAVVLWLIGSRNLVATHLPLVGRLAPLDSWWSTWRHFFATWSPNGVGTGTPGAPGYGVLGFAGTFVLGRMGILARATLIFAIPIGAVGVSRLLRGRVSNRARVIACVAYLAMPIGLNMISQGRLDVLVVSAGLPFIVRRIFELMDVPGFRTTPYSEAVQFGHRGWRTTEAGQRMVLFMLVALLSALAPATLVAAVAIVIGVAVARLFDSSDGVAPRTWRLGAAVIANVAILLLPLTINTVFAGGSAPSVFGLVRGPWSSPSFWSILRGADGGFGAAWWGWLLPAAALLGLALCKDERRRLASTAATIATIAVVIATLDARHLMGSFAPDLDVMLVLYMTMVAVLIALGVSALELDVRGEGFGWRQLAAGLLACALVGATLPFAASFISGRFNLPTTSVAESLSTLTPSYEGGYRVLWLGDPAALPIAGWNVSPGLSAATTMNGLPGGSTLFSPPNAGTSDVLLNDVRTALEGRTVRLGDLLAPAGVSTIVVMNASAPELEGVQSVPRHPVPAALEIELARQNDLRLVLATSSVEVYSNIAYHGVVSESIAGGASTPVIVNGTTSGPVTPGATIVAGLAPASAFSLSVDGHAVARSASPDWTQTYVVPTSTSSTSIANLVVHRFPWNGIIAGCTLLMWLLMWLGFGWIHRLEWLFSGRRPRSRPRHVKVEP